MISEISTVKLTGISRLLVDLPKIDWIRCRYEFDLFLWKCPCGLSLLSHMCQAMQLLYWLESCFFSSYMWEGASATCRWWWISIPPQCLPPLYVWNMVGNSIKHQSNITSKKINWTQTHLGQWIQDSVARFGNSVNMMCRCVENEPLNLNCKENGCWKDNLSWLSVRSRTGRTRINPRLGHT